MTISIQQAKQWITVHLRYSVRQGRVTTASTARQPLGWSAKSGRALGVEIQRSLWQAMSGGDGKNGNGAIGSNRANRFSTDL